MLCEWPAQALCQEESQVNFENEEFNKKISATDLVDSDLSPVAGGIVKKISIKASTFSLGRKYVIALKATALTMDKIRVRFPT